MGLYFIAFTSEPGRIDRMLRRMFGTEDGLAGRLTEFSRPVSGSYRDGPSIPDNIVCASSTVEFFATTPQEEAPLVAALQRFSPLLPSDVKQNGLYAHP